MSSKSFEISEKAQLMMKRTEGMGWKSLRAETFEGLGKGVQPYEFTSFLKNRDEPTITINDRIRRIWNPIPPVPSILSQSSPFHIHGITI